MVLNQSLIFEQSEINRTSSETNCVNCKQWHQELDQVKHAKSKVKVIMILSTGHDVLALKRQLDHLLPIAKKMKFLIFVTRQSPTPDYIKLLRRYPTIKTAYHYASSEDNNIFTIQGYHDFKSYMESLFELSPVCLHAKQSKTLWTMRRDTNSSHVAQKEFEGGTDVARNTYEDNEFKSRLCRSAEFIHFSLSELLKTFPYFDRLLFANGHTVFCESTLRYFQQISRVFDEDQSVYCIGSSYPLVIGELKTNVSFIRTDNFLPTEITMTSKTVVDEIVKHYKISLFDAKNYDQSYINNPLKDVGEWFSKWKNKKSRGCILPVIPVTPKDVSLCQPSSGFTLNLSSTMRHKYSVSLLKRLFHVVPLSFKQLPCKSDFIQKSKNSTFSIFIKMNSVEDDNTLIRVLKCLGFGEEINFGGFDGLYTIHWNKKVIYIVGAPYSRFTQTIPEGGTMNMDIIEEISADSLNAITSYKDHKHKTDNLSTVSFVTLE